MGRARLNGVERVLVVTVALTGSLVAGCGRGKPTTTPATRAATAPAKGKLVVFCGAGIRPPMEAVRAEFERREGVVVKVNYAGSGMLLGQLLAGTHADLYLPGDAWWVDKAAERGLVEDRKVVAWFVPVLAVRKGNPRKVRGLADLARTDLRVGLGKAEACAVGEVARRILAAEGLADRVKPAYESVTVNDLTNQVKIGSLDVALVWDAVAKMYPGDIDIVPIELADYYAVPLAMGVLKGAKDKALARKLMNFAASETGAELFRTYDYQVPGPVLDVRSGGSFRNPVNELADLFEHLTGRKVTRTFAGSGELLLQMEQARQGDVYICHDPYAALATEKGMARRFHTVAYLHPTIAVRKGNPKGVKGLMDLLRPDLKVGLPHRRYSTCGQITWAIFRKQGIYRKMADRKPYETRSSGDLANQLKLGSIDVAVMWDAIARSLPEDIDLIPIEERYRIDAVTSATSGRSYPVRDVKVTVVELTFAKEPLLAAQFARLATSEKGKAIWKRHHFDLEPLP